MHTPDSSVEKKPSTARAKKTSTPKRGDSTANGRDNASLELRDLEKAINVVL